MTVHAADSSAGRDPATTPLVGPLVFVLPGLAVYQASHRVDDSSHLAPNTRSTDICGGRRQHDCATHRTHTCHSPALERRRRCTSCFRRSHVAPPGSPYNDHRPRVGNFGEHKWGNSTSLINDTHPVSQPRAGPYKHLHAIQVPVKSQAWESCLLVRAEVWGSQRVSS